MIVLRLFCSLTILLVQCLWQLARYCREQLNCLGKIMQSGKVSTPVWILELIHYANMFISI